MKLANFIASLKSDQIGVVYLNSKKIRILYDADDKEGWVLVPDLGDLVSETPVQKKLTGEVRFEVVTKL